MCLFNANYYNWYKSVMLATIVVNFSSIIPFVNLYLLSHPTVGYLHTYKYICMNKYRCDCVHTFSYSRNYSKCCFRQNIVKK